ncbi:ribose/galactose ABC transporter substrate-binding protein [Williamsoniiplasma luminosum]|uniref:Ribose/galactose ABC transporter substrate-binding protein n=1 Tax=Williamsoniiplasma luminosum TaxID=214888 RepID=A0A2K8NVQ6_9MOLU|nr:hypothetical protein [Williamsoniiplasma luminosum]ATZ17268.1 ribose/galactose ABC transporter substrate-binding protein [Williamsoniiplasma luminosum]
MKKIMVHLSALSTIGLTGATVVGCLPARFADGVIGQRIVIVSDGGNIRDQSFNESSWESIINYGSQIHTNIYTDETRTTKKVFSNTKEDRAEAYQLDYASSWAGRDFRLDNPMIDFKNGESFKDAKKASTNYVETAGHDSTNFYAAYKMGLYKKADAMLVAGFSHLASVQKLIKWMAKDKKTLVLLDAKVDYQYKQDANGKDIPTQNQNVISVQYDSELSGFNAAWDAALWANLPKIDMTTGKWDPNGGLNGDASGDGRISMGTFGGLSSKTSVDNSMWGYLVGIELFNQIIAEKEYVLTDVDGVVKNFKPEKIKFGNVHSGLIDDVRAVNNADANWFSNSFAYGDANRNGILPHLIENGTDIIMGVAGPQTNDIALQITGARYKPFIVGIDTDQIKTIGKDTQTEARFITSSTKGLAQAALAAFKKSRSLKHIYKDESKSEITHFVNDPEIQDGYLAKQEPDWTISASRDAADRWKIGKNLAINAIKYDTGFAKTLFTAIPKVYQEAGFKPENYLNAKTIQSAVKTILQASEGKPSLAWKIEVDGVDGYVNYLKRLLSSFS